MVENVNSQLLESRPYDCVKGQVVNLENESLRVENHAIRSQLGKRCFEKRAKVVPDPASASLFNTVYFNPVHSLPKFLFPGLVGWRLVEREK